MEKWEHAVEVFKEIPEQRKALGLWGQLSEYSSLKNISKDFRLPISPLVLVHRRRRYHLLERRIASFLIDPLYALWRKY